MPSVSLPQQHLMAGIAHGWHPSHMAHPPSVNVAQDFNQADAAARVAAPHSMAASNPAMYRQRAMVHALRSTPNVTSPQPY